ncbi:MAG TPA: asparagine synthase-related protein [Gammaproteobacteria bacterium]
MVRAVMVVSRHPGQPNRLDEYRDVLNRKLAGNNITPRPAIVVRRSGLSAALLNPSGAARMHGASIAVGTLLEPADDWHVPGAALPDGSFALLRAGDEQVELAADAVGSRTLWYALTDRELIASSSQRAIVTLLGSFEPNRDVLPWMLSSGTLGPTAAWDARVQRVQPGERVLLDRARWRLTSSTEALEFAPDEAASRAAQLERLRAAVSDACRRWSFDARKWVLTLSGGTDSRSLLCLLRHRGIEAVTWGVPASANQDGSDAHVARLLASSLAVPHRFFAMDSHCDAAEVVLDRFLAAGEGRVARISGYVDGFRIWKTLYDEGYDGIIRGDEAFGSVPVSTPFAVRFTASLTTLADYFSREERETFELPEQRLPAALERGPGETLATWRDRLYQQFRVPTLLAGLTDIKTAYVEVGNPLLARSVLDCVRALPDSLRTEKCLWRELVGAQLPDVALATRVAIPSLTEFLADRGVQAILLDELTSQRSAAVFSPLLRARCCAALRAAGRPFGSARRENRGHSFSRAVPERLRAVVRKWRVGQAGIEPLVLAFRAFVAVRMHDLLGADSATPPARLEPAVNA